MTTVRELVQALILNCDLDDKIEVEYTVPTGEDTYKFGHEPIRRVFHIGIGESIIECHDE